MRELVFEFLFDESMYSNLRESIVKVTGPCVSAVNMRKNDNCICPRR